MRLHALVITSIVAGSACSLLAPSDAELMGSAERVEPAAGTSGANPNGGAGPSGGTSAAGAGGRSPGGSGSGTPAQPGGAGAGGTIDPGGSGEPGVAGNDTSTAGAPGAAGEGSGSTGPGPAGTSTAGLLLWLRGDAGVVLEAGGVSRWEDASGEANHATQSAAAIRPTRVAVGAGALPMISFDGIDDYLVLPSGFSDFGAGLTVFAVLQESSGTGCPSVLQLSNGSEIDDIDLGLDNTRAELACAGASCRAANDGNSGGMTRTAHYEVGTEWLIGAGGVLSALVPNVLTVVHRPDQTLDVRINRNAIPGTGIALPAVRTRSSNFLGRTLYSGCGPFRGRIGEILLYSRVLPDEERDRIESYLTARW